MANTADFNVYEFNVSRFNSDLLSILLTESIIPVDDAPVIDTNILLTESQFLQDNNIETEISLSFDEEIRTAEWVSVKRKPENEWSDQ